MERRFAVHAGADTAQALSGQPRARIAVTLALGVVLSAPVLMGAVRSADARPKKRDAKAAFDRGVVAYQKGDFRGASEALGKSFELERDVDTLFAWAQTERKLDHCDKAIDLYQQLLTFNLPTANKTAVENKLAECRTIIAQQSAPPPPSEPAQPPAAAAPASSAPAGTPPSGSVPAPVAVAATSSGPPAPETPSALHGPYVFYKDPVVLGGAGVGVVAVGVGFGFLAAAHSASGDARTAPTYQSAVDANHKVDQRNHIAAGGLIIGSAVIAGSVGWGLWKQYGPGERRTVTGWLAPGGGGLVISGPL